MSTYLTIKNPCHENWEDMNPSEKGRFCSSCKKQVQDFTISSLEVARQILLKSDDRVCGRFSVVALKDQYLESRLKNAHGSFLRRFSFAVLLCFGASLFTVDKAEASELNNIKNSLFSKTIVANDSIILYGTVKDAAAKEALPFTRVVIYVGEKKIGWAETNMNGAYRIKISAEYSKVTIKTTYIGYLPSVLENVELSKGKNKELNIDLELGHPIIMGDYIEEPRESN